MSRQANITPTIENAAGGPLVLTTSVPPANRPEPQRETDAAPFLLTPGDQFGLATISIEVDANGHLVSGPDYRYTPSRLETVGTALLGLAKCEEERQPIIELLARLRQYDNVRLAVRGPGAEAFTKRIQEARP